MLAPMGIVLVAGVVVLSLAGRHGSLSLDLYEECNAGVPGMQHAVTHLFPGQILLGSTSLLQCPASLGNHVDDLRRQAY